MGKSQVTVGPLGKSSQSSTVGHTTGEKEGHHGRRPNLGLASVKNKIDVASQKAPSKSARQRERKGEGEVYS